MRVWPLVVCIMVAGVAGTTAAENTQDGKTGPLARELTALLQQSKLDSVAARHAEHDGRFIAALYLPGQELIVVSAQYPAPALLREKILLKRYRDAYMDLYATPDAQSKRLVEDLHADGISAEREEGQPFDIYTKGDTAPFAFDGDWKKRKLREEEYLKVFSEADAEYAAMLQTLIAQLKSATP